VLDLKCNWELRLTGMEFLSFRQFLFQLFSSCFELIEIGVENETKVDWNE
jgi:hypothetical protein